jgi:endonuclease G, mitochondrial
MKSRLSSVIANEGFLLQIRQSRLAAPETVEAWLRQKELPAEGVVHAIETRAVIEVPGGEEAVVLLEGRPSLLIRGNCIEIPRSGIWVQPLLSVRALVEPWLRSVGRVEIDDGFGSCHGGTGWMIAKGVIATNRHVAEAFSAHRGGQVVFLANCTGTVYKARVDFREEYQEPQQLEIAIEKVLFMQEHDPQKPDVALLKLHDDPQLPPPIPILTEGPQPGAPVAVIGYPAYDPRYGMDALEAARAVFGSIYGVKRLSPGQVMDVAAKSWYFTHDATTLGGNSGSVVLDLKSGLAVGMHFRGEFRTSNYAILASEVAALAEANNVAIAWSQGWDLVPPPAEQELERPAVADYTNREGYAPAFLSDGNPISIPLPKPSNALSQELVTWGPNNDRTELQYTHFSVVMHAKRRMCVFSAVNIDGSKSVSVKGQRPRWRVDPRLPDSLQILGECYGHESEGKFSRGHMTRREDPNWGTEAVVKQANADTFHVTNACPQMQPFNAGIWNGLEDYALQNARQDIMRISVFTGPIFREDDRTLFEVLIPVSFWKVIAFIHDGTGKLTATGYTMSQRDFLPGEEFVFGQYGTYQTPLSAIEQMTQLSFGELTKCDPMRTLPEAPVRPLRGFEEILFV